MAARTSGHTIGRWLLGGTALAFLLVPGHRSTPLAGVPIADVWFFVALLLLGLFFVAMPWRRVPLRRLRLHVAALAALCVIKVAVGFLGAGLHAVGVGTVIVQEPDGSPRVHTLADLLPHSFGPSSLGAATDAT